MYIYIYIYLKKYINILRNISIFHEIYHIYGENFQFNDTSELEYGLPARKFNSFISASEEAAISRLYGGIHYMMAIEEGVNQGQEIGEFIVNKIQTLKEVKEESSLASN